jgi:ABC-2 type transport system permease protein
MSTIVSTAPQAAAAMAASRLRGAYLSEAKYAFLRFLRAPAFAVPTLLFPVFFYLLIGYIFGAFKAQNVNVPMYLYCSFAIMAAMTPGMFGFGMGLAMEREQGLFVFKRALPVPPMAAVFGNVAMSVLSTVLAIVPLTLAAFALGLIEIDLPMVMSVTAVAALGALPFCAIGLLIGSMTSARAAPAIVNILYILFMYLSGLFMPLPKGIAFIALGTPAFYLHQLGLEVAGLPNFIMGTVLNHIVVLVGVTLLCLGLAVRRLQRLG